MPIDGTVKYTWQHQPDAELTQANPVQNTWYPVINATGGVRIIYLEVDIAAAVEDLECRVTIDGNVLTAIQPAAIIATPYYFLLWANTPNGVIFNVTDNLVYRTYLLEGDSVTVEVRKTTALGAGALHCLMKWARLLPA